MTIRRRLLPNFKHIRQVVLEKKIFEYSSMYFYGLKLGPLAWGHLEPWDLARGHLGPWDLHLNKLGIGVLGNATYKFQTSGPGGSEEEDFLIYFYVFLRFEPRTPWHLTILDPGTLV